MPETEKAGKIVERKPKPKKQLMMTTTVEEIIRELVDADFVTLLTFVPCQNGILEKLREVYHIIRDCKRNVCSSTRSAWLPWLIFTYAAMI